MGTLTTTLSFLTVTLIVAKHVVVNGCRSKLFWSVSGKALLRAVCSGEQTVFGSAVVPPAHRRAFLHTGGQARRLC